MDKRQLAIYYHDKQFNCAQSVFAALAEDVGLDLETALKISTCFGGGMRCGEVCGAVTGALMAIGTKFGSAKENDMESKMPAYKMEVEFLDKFKEKYGCLRCMDLLGYDTRDPEQAKKVSELGLRKTVCQNAIMDAAEIADNLIK